MKRARRRSAGSVEPQSDVSYSDTDDYKPNSGSVLNGERSSSQDPHKVELRRLKNREAARRVRERKSNQLNTYKSQVDELKRENQKLLQIIAQLQSASLGCVSPAVGAVSVQEGEGPAGTVSHSCLSAGESGGGPSGLRSVDAHGSASLLLQSPEPTQMAAAAAVSAGGPPLAQSQQQQQPQQQPQQQQQQQRLLATTTSCPPGAGAPAAAAHDAGQSSSCIMSQPVNSSSTLQLLSGCHSAPHGGLLLPSSSTQARMQMLLQRTCSCQGDEACDECEGVRVTLSSASNLPLVTTPGPRPKLLTLDDLNLAGLSRGTSHPTGSLMSAPQLPCRLSGSSLIHRDDHAAPASAAAAVASGGHCSGDGTEMHGHHHYMRRKHHKPSQAPVKESEVLVAGMDVDLVGTLEPSRPQGLNTKMDSHSSSGNAVFGGAQTAAAAAAGAAATAAVAAPAGYNESCYVRKTSSNTTQRPAQQQQLAQQQTQQQPQLLGSMPQLQQQQLSSDVAAVVSGSALSGPGSGSAIQLLQQQLQQQQMFLQAAALSGSFNALQVPGAAPAAAAASGTVEVQDLAAAADVYLTGCVQADQALQYSSQGTPAAAAAAGVLPPAVVGALGSMSSQEGAGLVGSNSSMMRPGSYVKSEAGYPSADAAGMQAGSFTVPGMVPVQQQQPAAASSAELAAYEQQLQLQQQQQQQQQQVGSRKSGKTGQKLMRSIAAAVNTLVRPGRRNGGAGTSAAAAGQPSDLVTRSMSALPQGYTAATAAAAAAAAPASFTTGASGTAAMYRQDPAAALAQQAMLLNSPVFAADYTTKQQQQSQELLGQLLTAFDGQTSPIMYSGMVQPSNVAAQPSNPQQAQPGDDPDSIILAAQQLLHRKHQQRSSAAGSGSTASGSMPAPAAAAAAGQLSGGEAGGSSRRPSGAATAMDTTPIWLGQGSPRLPPQQQQQQGVFGLEQLSQPMAAAVLPLDFQATYTDGCLMDGADADGLLEDVVMQLARQEGVLLQDRNGNVESFF